MNFSTTVKKELCTLTLNEDVLMQCELYGYLQGKAELIMHAHHTPSCMHITNKDAAIIRRCYKMLKALFSCTPALNAKKSASAHTGNLYTLTITPPKLEEILSYYQLYDSANRKALCAVNETLLNAATKRSAFFRGLFLACGTVSAMNENPHLELRVRPAIAASIQHLLFLEGINAQKIQRTHAAGVYIKSNENIVAFLAMIGAHGAALAIESEKVFTQMKADTNRRRNCDVANISKAVESGVRQAEAFSTLMETDIFPTLSDPLKETLLLRIANPECSLSELCALNPAVCKSTLHKRLKRLMDIYTKNLENEDLNAAH